MKLFALFSLAIVSLAASPPSFYRSADRRVLPKAAQAQNSLAIVNAASYQPGISPGSLATIFGPNLLPFTGTRVADTSPLPTQLGGVMVYVNGVSAPIFSTSSGNRQDQISFQVPLGTRTGPNAAQIEVDAGNQVVAQAYTDVFTNDPGIFTLDGTYAVAVRSSDYTLVTRDNPVRPGEYLIFYGTGLGQTTNDPPNGYASTGRPLAYAVDQPTVYINGEPTQVLYGGLAPGFVAVYQLNVQLPYDLPRGDLDVVVRQSGGDSVTVRLPVR